jgi:hypothetical protein
MGIFDFFAAAGGGGGGGIGIPGVAKAFTNNPSFVTLDPSKRYDHSGLKIFRFIVLMYIHGVPQAPS